MTHHPRLPFYDELATPGPTAAALGYRMPGEFEPIDAVWLTYPVEPTTWPGCFDRACEQYDFFMSQVARFADVELVNQKHGWPVNDSWIRDYGPIFVVREGQGARAKGQGAEANEPVSSLGPRPSSLGPSLACHDFIFNGWGGKYGGSTGATHGSSGSYPDDDVVPQRVARLRGVPIWVHDFVLEGGSIEVDGAGTVLTTEQCLLAPTRNPGLTRPQIEQKLRDTLGVTNVVWLPGGIEGDDTDGHIDDLARFVAPGVVAAIRAPGAPGDPPDHPDHAVLEANWSALQAARDANGQPFELIELPVPRPLYYDFPADRWGPAERRMTPASYANFLIVNDAVLVPVFGEPTDDPACRAIESALPGRSVIPVPARYLVIGLGALHCLSQQQPKGNV